MVCELVDIHHFCVCVDGVVAVGVVQDSREAASGHLLQVLA